MSEVRRVALTTLSSDVRKSSTFNVPEANSIMESNALMGETSSPGAPSSKRKGKSFRIDLKLFEPNADSYPEFHFPSLLRAEKKKQKKSTKSNGFSDPFEADGDDDVARIAKEMERKYAGYGRSGNNHYDKGAGYDDSDSFIDNSEAYDELVPENYQTARGGFYINSGLMDYLEIPNLERPEDELRMPKPKKRLRLSSLESSASDDSMNGTSERETVKNGDVEKKSKVEVTPIAIKSNDKETADKEKEKTGKVNKEKKADKELPSKVLDEDVDDPKKVCKTTTVKDMLRAKRDNLRLHEQESKNDSCLATKPSGSVSTSGTETSEHSEESQESLPTQEKQSLQPVQQKSVIAIPDNIPDNIMTLITKMTDAVDLTNKGNYFDSNIVNILLKLDCGARTLGKEKRNSIYNYLEFKLPFTKQTILTKLRKGRTEKEETKRNRALHKLKSLLQTQMPPILKEFEKNLKHIADLKTSGMTEIQIKTPRKRYHWDETSRSLVTDIMAALRTLYSFKKVRKETEDEFINSYLKNVVVPLWPSGWMRVDELRKESDRKSVVRQPKENKQPPKISSMKLPSDTIIELKSLETKKVYDTVDNENRSLLKTPLPAVDIPKCTTLSVSSKSSTNINQQKSSNTSSTNELPKSSTTSSSSLLPSTINKSLTITAVDSTTTVKQSTLSPACPNTVTITNVDTSNNSKTSISDQLNTVLSSHLSSIIDLTSPAKKATDHSIDSLLTSAHHSIINRISPSPVSFIKMENISKMSYSPTPSPSPSSVGSNTEKLSRTTPSPSFYAHSNNIYDNIKLNHESISLIPTQAKSLITSSNQSMGTSGKIRIRSVENLNSIADPSKVSKVAPSSVYEKGSGDSDSSDGVELVGVYPMSLTKSTANSTTKQHEINIGTSSLANNVPNSNPIITVPKESYIGKQSTVDPAKRNQPTDSHQRGPDSDVDVNQIMRALKELQEMQQPKSESTALKTLQSAAIHHHYLNQHSSSNQYGNKLDHSDVISGQSTHKTS